MNLHEGHLLQGGKYRIERELGHGGFGITYLATQTGLNRKVAIKEFFMSEYCERNPGTSQVSVGSSGSRETVEKFRRKFIKEAQTLSSLRHANIIAIYDIFEENGTAYYVMEYHDKGSLADKIKSKGRLPEATALAYIRQVADALDYLHGRKMNHLDVKPGNILLDEKNNAILIDFGLTKHYDGDGRQTSTTPVGMSHGYAPLEQYKRGGVSTFSPETDIYSLGATLYKLVTGATPPEANDIYEDGLPPLPSTVSAGVQSAIKAAMQPRRKERPQSIGEFLKILDGSGATDEETTIFPDEPIVVPDEPVRPQPAPRPAPEPTAQPDSSPLKKMLLPIIIVAAALFTFLLWPKGSSAPETPAPAKQTAATRGTINGHEWVDLGLSVKWATCNVGAESPEEYGNYFAWGETTTKSEYTYENSKTHRKKNIDNIAGVPEYDAAAANWGGSWRMPTKAEMQELINNCIWENIYNGNIRGLKLTSKKNGNSIFLPAAGYHTLPPIDGAGKICGSSLSGAGDYGYYWCSTTTSTSNLNSDYFYSDKFYFEGRSFSFGGSERKNGCSVRPVTE